MQRPGASGGPGGGSRTRKSFRPETSEVSAFTSFATPAPHRLRTLVRPKAETPDLARAAVPRRKICWELFLPHRVPVAAQLSRQHPLHALRLRVGQGVELGVQIGPQPQPVLPHVPIVLHAVLVALEPRRGVEPRHPHIQRRLAGVMTGIGGAELGMLEHGGIELDHIDVVSRHLPRHADQSSSGRPRSRYFDGGWNSTSRRRRMTKGRLEAFSDGVIAILMTIMVLELKVPHGTDWDALRPLLPVFLTYVLSFVMVGIYWNNHHHMLHAAERINGKVMWANLHLLFWLSLTPFITGWMGENHFAPLPTALYGAVLLCSAIAYTILQTAVIGAQGPHSNLATAVGSDLKGKLSIAAYVLAIPLAFVNQWISDALYVAVALVWLVPDRRIEAHLTRA